MGDDDPSCFLCGDSGMQTVLASTKSGFEQAPCPCVRAGDWHEYLHTKLDEAEAEVAQKLEQIH